MRSRSSYKSPFDVAKEWLEKDQDPPGFCIVLIPGKGRGVKACKPFRRGDFILHYYGETVSGEQGDKREEINSTGYRFFFKAGGLELCIDATEETGRLGRLVNHGEKNQINCIMKQVQGTLCLFSTRDIKEGEELLYHYGVKDLPWKKHVLRFTFLDVGGRRGSQSSEIHGSTDNVCPETQASCSVSRSILRTSNKVGSESQSHCSDSTPQSLDSSGSKPEAVSHTSQASGTDFVTQSQDSSGSIVQALECVDSTSQASGTDSVTQSQDSSGSIVQALECVDSTSQASGTDSTSRLRKESLPDALGTYARASVIVVTKEGEDGPAFPLTSQVCNIGRSKDCDIRVSCCTKDVECKLFFKGAKVYQRDYKKGGKTVFLKNNSTFVVGGRIFKLKMQFAAADNELEPPSENSDDDIEFDLHLENSDDDFEMESDLGNSDSEWKPPSGNINVDDSECESSLDADSDEEGSEWEPPSIDDVSDENMLTESHDYLKSDYLLGKLADREIPPSVIEYEEDDSPIKMAALHSNSSTVTGTSEQSNSTVIPNMASQSIILQHSHTDGKRRNNKLHCCIFCEKMYARISRHYMQVHSEEPDVAAILIHPKRSKKRKSLWEKLVNKGNFNHNYQVLQKKHGVLITKYRPRKNQSCESNSNYVPCEFCLGMFVSTDLWKHMKTCKCADQKDKRRKGNLVHTGKLLLPSVGTNHELFENIITKMRDDAITGTLTNDSLILAFGDRLYEKNGQNDHQHQYISQRLRELGRLLITMKKIHPSMSFTLSSCLDPSSWEFLIDGVRSVAGYNKDTHKYEIPSLPLKLGHSLGKCANIMKTKAIKEDDDVWKKKADGFLELYHSEWAERVSSRALCTLHDASFNRPMYVPLAEDVKKLMAYLKETSESLKVSIEDDSSCHDQLAEVVLAQLIIFNRKRSGETQRIKVDDFKEGIKGSSIPANVEAMQSLSKFEKELCRIHYRIEIKGKRGRKVPLLMTSDVKESIEVMLKYRQNESKYLFMKNNNNFHVIRGCDVVRKFSNACGADHPEYLTSTRIRKHLATMSQVLGLTEGNQDMLARFMGHDIRIHRQFYRLPANILEMAKVSKILHLINTGSISDFKGKDFDEIQFENDEPIDDFEQYYEQETAESVIDSDEEVESGNQSPPAKKTKIVEEETSRNSHPRGQTRKQQGDRRRRVLSRKERSALMEHFSNHIQLLKVPGKLDCLRAQKGDKYLENIEWKQIKYGVYNIIQARKRMK